MSDTYDFDRADHDQREADIGDEIADTEARPERPAAEALITRHRTPGRWGE